MERKYAIQGIIGCLLFGLGDWLLGFVDPSKVDGEVFYFISAGHGADYADWKIVVTLVSAVIGVLFFSQGCVHIADFMKAEKDKAGARRVFSFITYPWLTIHFTVTIMVFTYSYMCKNTGESQAVRMSQYMDRLFDPFVLLSYFIVLVAFVDLIIVIVKGKTRLKKSEAFLTPVTWICVIVIISMILPKSTFSKGLYTFSMNGGMIIWFIRELFRKQEEITDVNKV